MRATLTGLAFAGALSLVCYQSADAVPADAGAMKRAATATSTVQEGTSHPARHHQVLPGIRRGAARLPPLPSLVVVVKPGSRAASRWGGEQHGAAACSPTIAAILLLTSSASAVPRAGRLICERLTIR